MSRHSSLLIQLFHNTLVMRISPIWCPNDCTSPHWVNKSRSASMLPPVGEWATVFCSVLDVLSSPRRAQCVSGRVKGKAKEVGLLTVPSTFLSHYMLSGLQSWLAGNIGKTCLVKYRLYTLYFLSSKRLQASSVIVHESPHTMTLLSPYLLAGRIYRSLSATRPREG